LQIEKLSTHITQFTSFLFPEVAKKIDSINGMYHFNRLFIPIQKQLAKLLNQTFYGAFRQEAEGLKRHPLKDAQANLQGYSVKPDP
jgi:hypothetical protein